MPDLSVLIPARNEQWLARTIADVLANLRGDTEVIAVLDGAWANPPIPDHPRLTLVYLPEAIGQRAATNLAARLSTARYIMKLDAHCAVAEGFDLQLLETAAQLEREVIQIPAQFNLHVFDWACDGCGRRTYQGPRPETCETCGATSFQQVEVWQPRSRRLTTAWRFDRDLHFQYWGAYKHRPEGQGEIIEVMSCLGACWFLDRAWYWELDGLDEAHGSWGQMGTELACKAWLSGGRMVCNTRTWFAHLFRTQPGFGFPYALSQAQVEAARARSRALWVDGTWPKAIRPLSWLVEKFAPVPGWHDTPAPAAAPVVEVPAPRSARSTAGLLYYTDGRLDDSPIGDGVRRQLASFGLPITAVSIRPLAFGDQRLVLPLERGYLTMFRQILAGLEAMETDLVFFTEHDVLYHPSHVDFVPPDREQYHYNLHVWKVDATTGRAVHYLTKQTSGLCAYRDILLEHYRTRVARVEREGFSRRMGFEPGSHRRAERVDDRTSATWMSAGANLDIRHDRNLTETRWSPAQFRDARNCQGWTEAEEVPGWGRVAGRIGELLMGAGAESHGRVA